MTSGGLVILGALGRMGRHLQDAALAVGVPVTGLVDRQGGVASPVAGINLTTVTQVSEVLRPGDVLIDFSSPEAVPEAVRACRDCKAGLVLGTTGLSDSHRALLLELSNECPVVVAANYSIGVNLILGLVEKAATLLPATQWDCEIVEAHHHHKVDAPSGTALALADAVRSGRGRPDRLVQGRSGHTGERTIEEIGMHALRLGGVVGDHTVWFGSPAERVFVGHLAQDRRAFADGAVRASAWLRGRPAGMYSMREVLGL